MPKIEIFEPAGCCATSGAVVEQSSIAFNADMAWCKQQGLDVTRYNLSKNPQRFMANATVHAFLNASGADSLPLTLLDGNVVMAGRLPTRADFARWTNTPLTANNAGPEPVSCCSSPRMP
ncbi:arsenic metallochaperone ArsD family protein [Serratia rubidaea]|uniref:Arsenic metallochaperone ArsD family protein n=1 Tax=Serratia rubidaea TaxID=61652 RepID=A0ABS0MDB8_SERRU|nr:arsenic metallochaperone ArsD family protein [Serratia rubidaea]MBH1930317.1 arsenic metallochaperone ArsD family protein [Serratia rubidaea]MEB7586436.1 arsenic metallochaperone ArsD family protein [Serratia rubidaea]